MKKESRTTTPLEPNKLNTYFKKEAFTLSLVTISGIIYNVGLLSGPYFEGALVDELKKGETFSTIIKTVGVFLLFTAVVQIFRSVKRFYVRRFANNTLKSMRTTLYHTILGKSLYSLEEENTGSLMAKAAGDVDASVEGMRKFTTELFDTGVFMVATLVAMFAYDVRISLVTSLFIALAIIVAELLKKPVYKLTSTWRKSAGVLNGTTYEYADGAPLYRIYGRDKENEVRFDSLLKDYGKKSVKATVSENSMEPVYNVIVMGAVGFIILFGIKNVAGSVWTIGTFTTYMGLFAGLANKASHAATLFNRIQKATVSWNRIKPYLVDEDDSSGNGEHALSKANNSSGTGMVLSPELRVEHISFSFADKHPLFTDITFTAAKGTITGITGPVACGKSVFAHLFLGSESPMLHQNARFTGSILLNGNDIMSSGTGDIALQFHDSQLFSGTIYDNITLGDDGDIMPVLHAVCFDDDLSSMPEGVQTIVGNGGIRLSGGQQSRIALARTLYHAKSLLVLDDPFAAVDPSTEETILHNIRTMLSDKIVILISHRLRLFNQLDNIVVLHRDGTPPEYGTHDSLLSTSPLYASLFNEQQGDSHETN
jgi:ABC-type multidrug transport system fused ATPase/permease subunit